MYSIVIYIDRSHVDNTANKSYPHGVEKSLRLDVIKAADDAIQPGGSLVLPSTDRQLVVDALSIQIQIFIIILYI